MVYKKKRLLLVILFNIVLESCVRERAVIHELSKNRLEDAYRLTVPFVEQKEDGYCGPVALAMILNYWDDPVDQYQIARDIYLPSIKGTLSFDMVEYSKKRGFTAELYHGNFHDLKAKIALGYPIIALLGDSNNTEGHYLVVVGYDEVEQHMIVHKRRSSYGTMSYKRFLSLWSNMDELTILITP